MEERASMTGRRGLPSLAIVGAAVLALGGCTADSQKPAPQAASATGGPADPPDQAPIDLLAMSGLKRPEALAQAISAARLYLDRSKSLAGYAGESGGPLDDLTQALGRALLQQNVRRIYAGGFGANVEEQREVRLADESLAWEADAPRTCLATPVDAERSATGKARSLLLVVTDDVVSPTGRACAAKCRDVEDVGCVGDALFEYLKAGNGLWVFGVRVPYTGRYEAAVGTASFSVASLQRPIYVWIGGANAAVGRSVTERLVKWAMGRRPALDHIALEVWPGYWDEPRGAPSRDSTFSPWSVRSAAEAIAGWSTTDDAQPADMTKTLGFEPVWGNLMTRLESIRRTLR
jgi:hypothetical protein